MPAVINTNIPSLNSQRQLDKSSNALNISLQRLSSGMRINGAKDDAAGMAISDRMTAQIRGLNQAGRNANDAISLAQTAEGALSSVGDSLQRIRELAVQAANASNSAADRLALNNEASQLVAEIQRVSTSTSFNGVNLLDGTFTAKAFQVGADVGQTISIDTIANSQSTALGVGSSSSYVTNKVGAASNGNGLETGDLSINGVAVNASVTDGLSYMDSRSSAIALAAAVNAVGSGVTATAAPTVLAGTVVGTTVAIADKDILINGVNIGAIALATSTVERGAQMTSAINAKSSLTGVTASYNTTNGAVTLTAADGRNISIGTNNSTTLNGTTNTGLGTGGNINTHVALSNKIASGTASAALTSSGALTAGQWFINGFDVGQAYLDASAASTFTTAATLTVQNNNIIATVNSMTSKTGVTAVATTITSYTLVSSTGVAIEERIAGGGVGSGSATATFIGLTGLTITQGTTALNQYMYRTVEGSIKLSSSSANGITFADVSGRAKNIMGFATAGLTTATLTAGAGVSALDLTTAAGATAAITTIDAALTQVNSSRASLGAYQNRFSAVVSNLATTAENITASRSRIQDTDFAAETASMSRNQILQQAGTAMLAQANSLPNMVLSLLK